MKNLPLVSYREVFKNRKRILENPLPFHKENFDLLGDTFRVKVSPTTSVVFTRDAKMIRHILQRNHKKYEKSPLQTKDLAKYIGHGLLTSNGDHWRKHRRMVQPAFHKKKLKGLLGIMQKAIRSELKRILPNATQDVFPLMGDLTFQVVARSLFSRDDIQDEMAELQHITETNQKMLIKEMRQPYLKWWFRLSGEINHHLKLADKGRAVINSIVDERLERGAEKDDLLDMLLKARYEDGTAMSRRQLIDEVLILFTAGHETTANALSFTLGLLAENKEAQNKAFQEVSTVDWNSSNILENISKLQYVKQCIEEGMRLYPPAYIIDRITNMDDDFDGTFIKKNTLFLMSVYELHKHTAFWDNPDAFMPERFDPSGKKDFQEYYYPFGAGPRMCVGNNFAIYEMVMVISELLAKYEISIKDPLEINPLISLKPQAVKLHFHKR
ncbi:cytochrome P450 [uncultured Croceitalea sp.]|uniref:cytochrome P450 n=1 Tax=uncultured Croceitalea sp. TaxID=1798908 RepID=UPI003305ACDB